MVLVKTTPPFSNWPTTCLLRASKASSKEQVEAELGDDLETYIRASIEAGTVPRPGAAPLARHFQRAFCTQFGLTEVISRRH